MTLLRLNRSVRPVGALQGVFVQDFPFLPTGSPDDTTGFGKDLRDYLQKLSRCRHHIWGQSAPLVSISSKSSHQRSGLLCTDGFENEVAGNSGSRCGHPRLQEAITELKRVDFSAAQGERWFSGLRLLFIDGRSSRSLAALAAVVFSHPDPLGPWQAHRARLQQIRCVPRERGQGCVANCDAQGRLWDCRSLEAPPHLDRGEGQRGLQPIYRGGGESSRHA